MIKDVMRHWRPVAWRDERLAELLAEVRALRASNAELQARLAQMQREHRAELAATVREPGFMKQLWVQRREGERIARGAGRGRPHARRGSIRKLRNYALVASHGIPVPTVYAVWRHLSDVDFDSLPRTCVLKSDMGASGRGVFALRRVVDDPDRFEMIGTGRPLTGSDVRELAHESPGVRGRWFAEELLPGPEPHLTIPDDVKFYTFYGEVAHAMVRRVSDPRGPATSSVRYLDVAGDDIDISPKNPTDTSIPVPENYPDLVAAASRLSTVHALPFMRVDLYSTPIGMRLGELTPGPGGNHGFVKEHERHLGLLWEEAATRVHQDVADGVRPLGPVVGSHPVPELLAPFLPSP